MRVARRNAPRTIPEFSVVSSKARRGGGIKGIGFTFPPYPEFSLQLSSNLMEQWGPQYRMQSSFRGANEAYQDIFQKSYSGPKERLFIGTPLYLICGVICLNTALDKKINLGFRQCCRSMTFWCESGSGSADPCL